MDDRTATNPAEAEQPVTLSILLTSLNAAATIGEQLEALAAQQTEETFEIIVADGGSTDGTAAVVDSFRDRIPRLKLIDASAKRGIAYGFNRAAARASGRLLATLEADDRVAPGWVDAIVAGLRQAEFVASRFDTRALNPPWVWTSRETTDELPTLPFPPYLPYASTAGLGIRREVHEAVGGFDESLPLLQDTDYCIRVQQLGVELVFLPDALVHYRFRTRFGEIFRQARSYAEANALLQRRHGEGFPARPWLRWLLAGWKVILRALPGAISRSGRARLAWLLGWQAGRYSGSLKYRIRFV